MTPISSYPKRFPSSLLNSSVFRPSSNWNFASVLFKKVVFSTSAQGPDAVPPVTHRGQIAGNTSQFSSLATVKPNLDRKYDQDAKLSKVTSPRSSHFPLFPNEMHRSAQQKQQVQQNYEQHENTSLKLVQLELHGPRTAKWWTGKQPVAGVLPGMHTDGNLYSLPQLSLSKGSCTRESLQAYFDNTWTLTEVLLSSLQGEEAFMRSPYHDLRHPLIFYYGHPAALYVNKLRVAGIIKEPINSYFESVFETGVDEMSWDDLSKNKMPWPSVSEVHRYRKQVYATVSEVISNLTDEQCSNVDQSSPLWALAMAFEHERIHLETSSVLIAEMPSECLKFPQHFPAYHNSIPSANEATQQPVANVHYPGNEMVPVAAKSVSVGKSRDYPSFGWDNEYGLRTYEVPAFSASKFKVSNGEFLEFVRDRGYAKRELWSDDGWEWRAYRNAKWPSFWVRSGPQGLDHFDLRLTFDTVPMPWSWPAAVNFHEADAFARWKGLKTGKKIRVLTELEHKAIRDPVAVQNGQAVDRIMVPLENGRVLKDEGVNMNLSCGSMNPVDAHPANTQGFHDVFGNAWEWTSDYFCALPGFEVHPYYEDFSTPCFDGLHHVIQGGSFISTGNECSQYSRFHFRPHFFQHASFRIAEQTSEAFVTSDTDAPGPFVGSYPFRRSNAGLQNALKGADRSEYNAEYEQVKHFGSLTRLQMALAQSNVAKQKVSASFPTVQSIADIIFANAKNIGIDLSAARAIDVGCGPGAVSFELAAKVQSVIGIDHKLENINFAKLLLQKKQSSIEIKSEGELASSEPISRLPLLSSSTTQVEFRMADPMCLPAEMMGFDLVFINDVIDKVSSPNSVLGRLGGPRGLVRSGGLLAISSAFQWNADVTPRSLWLGGYVDTKTGEEVTSLTTLTDRISADFVPLSQHLHPVFWQESSSDYRCKLMSVTLWKRK